MWKSTATVGLAGLLLSACSVLEKKEPPPCPRVSILADAAQVTKFREGRGRDITDIEGEAEIGGYSGNCVWRDNHVEVVLQLGIQAKLGPAAEAKRSFDLSYFVAAPGFYPAPTAKAVLPIKLTFPENQSMVRHIDDEVVLTLPWAGSEPMDKYEVFLGFQLSDDQLEYNRSQKRR